MQEIKERERESKRESKMEAKRRLSEEKKRRKRDEQENVSHVVLVWCRSLQRLERCGNPTFAASPNFL